jgi:hypothetical protein
LRPVPEVCPPGRKLKSREMQHLSKAPSMRCAMTPSIVLAGVGSRPIQVICDTLQRSETAGSQSHRSNPGRCVCSDAPSHVGKINWGTRFALAVGGPIRRDTSRSHRFTSNHPGAQSWRLYSGDHRVCTKPGAPYNCCSLLYSAC